MQTNRLTAARLTFFSLFAGVAALLPAQHLHAATPATSQEFRIKKQWNLGGAGGWGYLSLDTAAHQLYIPRSNRVMVVDTITGSLLGEIGGMKSVRDIALDDAGRFGYVTDPTDGSAGFVHVFDRTTRKLVTSIPTGRIPAAIAFDPATKSVFAFNSHDHSATVIDTATNRVIATIPLSGRPGSAVADGKGNIFVALPAVGAIARIDAVQKKVIGIWQLAPCTGPDGLAIDAAHRQLFTTCEDHKLVAVNADTGHMLAVAQIDAETGNIDFDPDHKLLFLTDSSGVLSIFQRDSPAKYSRLQQVKTQPGARTMIVDPRTAQAYLVTSQFGQNTATASEELKFRPTPVPGTFSVIVVGR